MVICKWALAKRHSQRSHGEFKDCLLDDYYMAIGNKNNQMKKIKVLAACSFALLVSMIGSMNINQESSLSLGNLLTLASACDETSYSDQNGNGNVEPWEQDVYDNNGGDGWGLDYSILKYDCSSSTYTVSGTTSVTQTYNAYSSTISHQRSVSGNAPAGSKGVICGDGTADACTSYSCSSYL